MYWSIVSVSTSSHSVSSSTSWIWSWASIICLPSSSSLIASSKSTWPGSTSGLVFWVSSTKLKDSSEVLVDSEIIDGDYQYLGVGDLYIRWGGDDVANAFAYANDEYEIELYARSLGTSTAKNYGTIHLTRR